MKYNYRKNMFSAAIRRDMPFYMISVIILIIGVIVGSVAVKILDFEQKKNLVVYMNKFFQLVTKEEVKNSSLLIHSIKNNFQTVFFIWILSMTVIGIPFTMFMVAFKGFVTGFTIAFLIEGFGIKGLLFSLVAILPQNLIMIACILVLSAASLKYSLGLLKKNFAHKSMNVTNFSMGNFTTITGLVFLAMTIASIIEAFLSSTIIRLVSELIVIK